MKTRAQAAKATGATSPLGAQMLRTLFLGCVVLGIMQVSMITAQSSGSNTGSAATPATNVRMFVLNMSSEALTLQVGEGSAAVRFSAVKSLEVTKPLTLNTSGPLPMSLGSTDGSLERIRNGQGQPLQWRVASNLIYLVRILPDKSIDVINIPETAGDFGKIAFINAASSSVTAIEIGNSPGQNTLVSLSELAPRAASVFSTVQWDKAAYGLFYKSGSEQLRALGPDGKDLTSTFAKGSLSVAVFVNDPAQGGKVACRLLVLSP